MRIALRLIGSMRKYQARLSETRSPRLTNASLGGIVVAYVGIGGGLIFKLGMEEVILPLAKRFESCQPLARALINIKITYKFYVIYFTGNQTEANTYPGVPKAGR